MSFFTALTADPSLGRFDISSLSQQQLMEMLIENLHEALKYNEFTCKSTNEFLEVCSWPDVECDENKNVTSIQFDLFGSFGFSATVRQVRSTLLRSQAILNPSVSHATILKVK